MTEIVSNFDWCNFPKSAQILASGTLETPVIYIWRQTGYFYFYFYFRTVRNGPNTNFLILTRIKINGFLHHLRQCCTPRFSPCVFSFDLYCVQIMYPCAYYVFSINIRIWWFPSGGCGKSPQPLLCNENTSRKMREICISIIFFKIDRFHLRW